MTGSFGVAADSPFDNFLAEIRGVFEEIESHLPGVLAQIVEMLHGIPAGSENRLYQLADLHGEAMQMYGHHLEELGRQLERVTDLWTGDVGARATIDSLRNEIALAESRLALNDGMRGLAAGTAQGIEIAKWIAAINLVMLAWSLIMAIIGAFFTGGATLAAEAGAFTLCKMAIKKAGEELLLTIMRKQTLRTLGTRLASTAGRNLASAFTRAALKQTAKGLFRPFVRLGSGLKNLATHPLTTLKNLAANQLAGRAAGRYLSELGAANLRQTAVSAMRNGLTRALAERALARAGSEAIQQAAHAAATKLTGAAAVRMVSKELLVTALHRGGMFAGFTLGQNLAAYGGIAMFGSGRLNLDAEHWQQFTKELGSSFLIGSFGGPISMGHHGMFVEASAMSGGTAIAASMGMAEWSQVGSAAAFGFISGSGGHLDKIIDSLGAARLERQFTPPTAQAGATTHVTDSRTGSAPEPRTGEPSTTHATTTHPSEVPHSSEIPHSSEAQHATEAPHSTDTATTSHPSPAHHDPEPVPHQRDSATDHDPAQHDPAQHEAGSPHRDPDEPSQPGERPNRLQRLKEWLTSPPREVQAAVARVEPLDHGFADALAGKQLHGRFTLTPDLVERAIHTPDDKLGPIGQRFKSFIEQHFTEPTPGGDGLRPLDADGLARQMAAMAPVHAVATHPDGLTSAGAEPGLPPTQHSIDQLTVAMEHHPDFPRVLDYLASQGFHVAETDRAHPWPEAVVRHNVDVKGKVTEERVLHVVPGMRFLDLLHEVDHVRQLARFEPGTFATEVIGTRPNGRHFVDEHHETAMRSFQRAALEYEVRLREYIRLAERGVDPQTLRDHADGVDEHHRQYVKRVRGDTAETWVTRRIPELPRLEARAAELREAVATGANVTRPWLGFEHHASAIVETRFIPDGRTYGVVHEHEFLESALRTELTDFGGRLAAIGREGFVLRVETSNGDVHHFRVEIGHGMRDVSTTTMRAGTSDDPHVVTVNDLVHADIYERVWIHEITETLDEVGSWHHRPAQDGDFRRALSRALTGDVGGPGHAAPGPAHAHVNARLAERQYLMRLLHDERMAWDHENLRADLRGLDRELAESHYDMSRLEPAPERPGDSNDHIWLHRPEGSRPSVDTVIPRTTAEGLRWSGAIADAVASVFAGRDFGGLQVRTPDEHPVVAGRDSAAIRFDVVDRAGQVVGRVGITLSRTEDGHLIAYHDVVRVANHVQGGGFYRELNAALEAWYRESGVELVRIHAGWTVGGYAHAREGLDWDPNSPHGARGVFDRLRREIVGLEADARDVRAWAAGERSVDIDRLARDYQTPRDAEALLSEIGRQHAAATEVYERAATHPFGSDGYPTPREVADAGRPLTGDTGRDRMWAGKRALLGAEWHGVKYLDARTEPGQVTAARVPGSQQFHAFARSGPDPVHVGELARTALGHELRRQWVPLRLDVRAVAPAHPDSPTHPVWPGEAVARSVPVGADGRDLPPGTVPPAGGSYRIEVSSQAADLAVRRAVAHEVDELREIVARHQPNDRIAPSELTAHVLRRGDIPPDARLSPHDIGRLAERRVLHEQIGSAQLTEAERATARAELDLLDRELGLVGDGPASAVRQSIVAAHESARPVHSGGRPDRTETLHILAFDGGDRDSPLSRLGTTLGGLGHEVAIRAPGEGSSQLAPGVLRFGADPLPGVTGRLSPLLRADGLPAGADVIVGYNETGGIAHLRRDVYPDATVVQVVDQPPRPGDVAHGRVLFESHVVVAVGEESARAVETVLAQYRATQEGQLGPGPHIIRLADEFRGDPDRIGRTLDDVLARVDRHGPAVDHETWSRELSVRQAVLDIAERRGPPSFVPREPGVMTAFVAWDSGAGGGATANRELADSFHQAGAEVYARIPGTPDVARPESEQGIHVSDSGYVWGVFDRDGKPDIRAFMMLLDNLPTHADVVIGHSRFSGGAGQWLAEHAYPGSQYVHVLHSLPEQLDALRGTPEEGLAHGRTEQLLMDRASLVVGVGPLLGEQAARLALEGAAARGASPAPVHTMISDMPPAGDGPPPLPPHTARGEGPLRILIQGRATDRLKGVEFAAHIVAELRRTGQTDILLTVRGVPAPEAAEEAAKLSAIVGAPVEIRPRTTDAQELLQDLHDADLVLMPSVHEGFGLVASEAARAGVPVLVGEGTGAGRFFRVLEGQTPYVTPGLAEPAVVRDGITVAHVWAALDQAARDVPQGVPNRDKVIADLAIRRLDSERYQSWLGAVRDAIATLPAQRARALELQHDLATRYPRGRAGDELLQVLGIQRPTTQSPSAAPAQAQASTTTAGEGGPAAGRSSAGESARS